MIANELIEINTKTMTGKPIIKGTRVTVEQILESLSTSNSVNEVLKAYPHLTKEHVQAASAFAAQSIRGGEVYAFAK